MIESSRRCFDGVKATTIFAIIILCVYPLFTGISGYMYLQLKKYLFFLAVTLLWTAVLCVFGCIRLGRTHRIARPTVPDVCILVFAVIASLSTALSTYGVFFTTEIGKYDSLLAWLLYCVILLGVSHRALNLRACFLAFTAAYTACCVIALLQLWGLNALWLFPDGMNYYSVYVQENGAFLGTLGNVDVFSALHCLALPLFGAVLSVSADKRRRLLLIPTAMGAAVLVISRVASGVLAIGVTVILLLPVYYASRRGAKQVPRWVYCSGVFLLLVLLLACFFIPFRQGTPYELHEVLHGRAEDSFGSHRILIWRETVGVFREHPLLGIGPDTLEYYIDIVFERYSETLGAMQTYVDTAHSAYLQLLVNFGILGCMPVSVFLVWTVDGVVRRFRASPVIRMLCPSMLCYLIWAFFNIGTCMIVPLFLILWAILLHETREQSL